MSRVRYFPAGGVILNRDDAVALGRAIIAAQDIAGRHGARLQSNVLVLAAELTSIDGDTEPAPPATTDHVEYEQIDTTTAANILGCSPRNVRDLADRDRLPGVKRGRSWWFNRDDVLVYRDFR